jgi:predicted  nucleic acid-binding Zn-ribbon protein
MENQILQAIWELKDNMDKRFKETDKRLEDLGKELSGLHHRIDDVDDRIIELREEMEKSTLLTVTLDERTQAMEQDGKMVLDQLIMANEKLDNNREHYANKTDFMTHKSTELEERIYKLERRLGN